MVSEFDLKSVELESVKEKIHSTIERYEAELDLFWIVSDVLKEYEGKKITKRVTNKIQDVLDAGINKKQKYPYHVSLNREHYLNSISIYHGELAPGEPMRIYIRSHLMDEFNHDEFMQEQKGFTLHSERIPKLKESKRKLRGFVNRYNKIRNQYIELGKELDEYGIRYYMGGK